MIFYNFSTKNDYFQAYLLTVLTTPLFCNTYQFLRTLKSNLGCFPFDNRPQHQLSECIFKKKIFRVFQVSVRQLNPPPPKSPLPFFIFYLPFTYINFVENQIYLSLIDLSPLIKSYPNILQHVRVRSLKLIRNLLLIRSLSFGSDSYN